MGSIECGGVLFDLDGVLVDSTPAVTRVWHGWAIEHGYDPARVVKIAHGRRAIETVELVAPHLDSTAELAELERRELDDTDGLVVFKGAARLLASLPPDRWAVVTSGTRRLATKRLQVAGLPVPKKMVSADEVSSGSPTHCLFCVAPNCSACARRLRCGGRRSFRDRGRAPRANDGHRRPTTYPRPELSHADALLECLDQLQADSVPAPGGQTRILLRW